MTKIINIAVIIITVIYAALSVLAVVEQYNADKIFKLWYLLYFVGASLLIFSILGNSPYLLFAIAYITMIGIAIFTGYLTNSLHTSHIIVRTIFSAIMILLWYKITKV